MTDEAKALAFVLRRGEWDRELCKYFPTDERNQAADLIETQAREIERLNTILSEMNGTDVIARTMAENERLRIALHEIDVEAWNTIPPDGKNKAFAALTRILQIIEPFRIPCAALAGARHDQ